MSSFSAPFLFILFGGTGDLASRKLLPAFYHAFRTGQLHPEGKILGISRQEFTSQSYGDFLKSRVKDAISPSHWQESTWEAFTRHLAYCPLDVTQSPDYQALRHHMDAFSPCGGPILFYLSTSPSLFEIICDQLQSHGLATAQTRIILEKPLGYNLGSSQTINTLVRRVFDEKQIFRIDHYLGKESVQNLMALRFGNTLFEPLWRREWIDHIQITLAEEAGIGGRGSFYEGTGALRDMVQNHLLQLLCFIAMEPPASLDPDAIRDEKVRVLRSLVPFPKGDLTSHVVRGQYRSGLIGGKPVGGYRQEEGVDPQSRTETFVALKAHIANWRWANVPFFLRTGKRLPHRLAEIVIQFREVPHRLFSSPGDMQTPNRLVIRLQPDEHIRLYMRAKMAGKGTRLGSVHLDLDFSSAQGHRRPEAYERLLLDAIRGDLSLFVRQDELEQAWSWVEPLQDAWVNESVPLKLYEAGTWGPPASMGLLAAQGAMWHEDEDEAS